MELHGFTCSEARSWLSPALTAGRGAGMATGGTEEDPVVACSATGDHLPELLPPVATYQTCSSSRPQPAPARQARCFMSSCGILLGASTLHCVMHARLIQPSRILLTDLNGPEEFAYLEKLKYSTGQYRSVASVC
ncbi:uncharacterized protein [Lolium perenne]|uniref:uncharacterized protein n=1 Tax=Lolium perenne TaxID=4522 RepID=UPI003A998C3A